MGEGGAVATPPAALGVPWAGDDITGVELGWEFAPAGAVGEAPCAHAARMRTTGRTDSVRLLILGVTF
jgi:hypothetical protein